MGTNIWTINPPTVQEESEMILWHILQFWFLAHVGLTRQFQTLLLQLELVSKELNHFAAILHVYAGGLNFMKKKKKFVIIFQKENGNTYFYTFNNFYIEKSSKRAK